jgi:hypothetical protein
VLAEECSFYCFEARDAEAVREANRRAGVPFWRVVPATFIAWTRLQGAGIDFSADLALHVVRRVGLMPSSEAKQNGAIGKEKQ